MHGEEEPGIQTEDAETATTMPSMDNAFRVLPLRDRLQEMREEEALCQTGRRGLRSIRETISLCENGKKPIPENAAPLIRWVESGAAPTAEGLTARRRRWSGP